MRRECQSHLTKIVEGIDIALRVLQGQPPMNLTLAVLVIVGIEILKLKIRVKLSIFLIN
jgi:cell division protein ZapA (FtsZ GTPase activity inhibitor)